MTNRYLTENDKKEICFWKYDGNAFERTTEIGKGEFYRMVKV